MANSARRKLGPAMWWLACAFFLPQALCARADESSKLPTLRVPEGFAVERVAGIPQVERPMMAAFDDLGRLYVCDSAGVNLRGPELAKNPPHCIRMLEDIDGDGRFEKSRVFADKLVFPQGVCWHDGWLYVASPPNFWRMRDSDGDGVVDKREVLVTGFANTGVADDMHGASVGLDGRIYWCAGRFPHELRRPNGKVVHKGTAPLILRCKPDGNDFEVVCGAQGNAVGVAFTPTGDMFASGTYLAPPSMGAGLRDAIIHCVDGGEYPVRDRILNEHQRTGELLPPLIHLGVAAASDLTSYRHRQFGEAYRDNLFVALFNMHKVVRVILEREGGGYRCKMEDFLVSDDPDFHPTDVLEDADGSLLVVDTGGWFRIGCPTSQVAKPQVMGGIYRVRRTDARRPADPRGLKLKWKNARPAELIERLGSESPEICDRAMAQLAKGDYDAITAVGDAAMDAGRPLPLRINAAWTLSRMFDYYARDESVRQLAEKSGPIFQIGARAVGLHRDRSGLPRLCAALDAGCDGASAREAATALGRIGDRAAVPALLRRLEKPVDRFLEHSLIYALIRIGDADQLRAALGNAAPAVRRAGLIALDQTARGKLQAKEAASLLADSSADVRQGARWVAARHPEWGRELLPYFEKLRRRHTVTESERDELQPLLLTFCGNEGFQQMIAELLVGSPAEAERKMLLDTIAQAPLDRLPFAWKQALKQCLDGRDASTAAQAIACLRLCPAERSPVHSRVDLTIDFPQPTGPATSTPLKADYTVRWTGRIAVAKAGEHTFVLDSEDGSRLTIDGKVVVDNGGFHGFRERRGVATLSAGEHDIEVDYFLRGTGGGCVLSWVDNGVKRVVPAAALSHAGKRGLRADFFDFRRPDGQFVDFRSVDFASSLRRIAAASEFDLRTRVDALGLLAAITKSIDDAGFNLLHDSLANEQPPLTRFAAAEIFSRLELSPSQWTRLTTAVARAGVLELPKLLAAFERCNDAEVGAGLLAALAKSPGFAGLKAVELQQAIKGFGPDLQARAAPLLARLDVDATAQQTKLKQLAPLLKGGDAARGKEVFVGKKALCASCHQVHGDGGKIGPDLTKIAAIRAPNDLLEAVALPSASFARGYEPFTIVATDGSVRAGIIARETPDAVYLYDANRAEQRLARSAIEAIRRGDVSIMPQGLDTQLSPRELADLFAYLQSLK